MSEVTLPDLDLREQIVRIDRAITETRKFSDEALKLSEKARKFRRERWLIPVAVLMAAGAVLGSLGGLVTLIQWASRLSGHS